MDVSASERCSLCSDPFWSTARDAFAGFFQVGGGCQEVGLELESLEVEENGDKFLPVLSPSPSLQIPPLLHHSHALFLTLKLSF